MSKDNENADGRVAIVTGGARGIGRGIALRLAEDGLDVAVADLPSMRAESERVAEEIRAAGRRAAVIDVDVSDAAQVDAMVRATVDELGQLDVMVANAGVAAVGPLLRRHAGGLRLAHVDQPARRVPVLHGGGAPDDRSGPRRQDHRRRLDRRPQGLRVAGSAAA